MDTKERDQFLSYLFDRHDCELVNIKFLRGPSKVDQEVFCREAHRALKDALSAPKNTTPVSGRESMKRTALVNNL